MSKVLVGFEFGLYSFKAFAAHALTVQPCKVHMKVLCIQRVCFGLYLSSRRFLYMQLEIAERKGETIPLSWGSDADGKVSQIWQSDKSID